jgi:hypothetical protein
MAKSPVKPPLPVPDLGIKPAGPKPSLATSADKLQQLEENLDEQGRALVSVARSHATTIHTNPTTSSPVKPVSISLTAELLLEIDTRALRERTTRSVLVARALQAYGFTVSETDLTDNRGAFLKGLRQKER